MALYLYKPKIKKLFFSIVPEKIFLFLGIVYGMLLLLITPPFQSPDEPEHFYRSFQISEGHLVAQKRQNGIGGDLPESLYVTAKMFHRLILQPERKQNIEDIFNLLSLPLNKDNRIFTHFPNTAVYSPIPYLPQALAISLGKLFYFSPLLLMYLGRISNLLIWVLLVYFAIKLTPFCKWLFFLLALMPMSLFQAASLSADSFTNCLSFLLIALFLRIAFTENSAIQKRHIYILVILSLLLSLSKQVYFLIPLLFLLIPTDKFGARKKYFAIFFFFFFMNIVVLLIWYSIIDIVRDIYKIYKLYEIYSVSPDKQMLFILSHPLEYCRILVMTYMENWKIYMDSFVGQLGHLDTSLSELFRVSYLTILIFVALADTHESIVISLKQRCLIFLTLVASFIVINTIAYVGWTPVGKKFIGGIQGRYFIPISPLFFLLFYNKKFNLNLNRKGFNLMIICFSVFSLTYTLFVILHRYYF